MSLSTTEAVRETYRMALQQEVSRGLRSERDWKRFLAITKEGRDRYEAEKADYRENYTRRLADARAVVLRERTGVHLDQPRPEGAPDPLDKDNVDIQAKARIDRDHHRRVASIIEDEIGAYRELAAELQRRGQIKGVARDNFNMTSRNPTRTGPSRS